MILERAIWSLVGCFVVGCGVGALCETAVSTEIERYLNEKPAPNSDVTVEELMAQMQREYEEASSEDAPNNTKNSS